jgi:heterodisulfide reductase subunit B
LGVGSSEYAKPLAKHILTSASRSGAKVLAVSCPLCKYNLETAQGSDSDSSTGNGLPIVYFTQLLGLALGLAPQELQLDAHQLHAIQQAPMLKVP